jgi:aminoglycoside phosphotransferase family enzyme/predicted kinase
MIAALLRPEAYPHPTGTLSLVETHISWVLLTGPWAYKIKKPVNLGFVDFSTLARRRHFCLEELRLNQRLAGDLYGDLAEIHGPAERASLGGSGPVIEVAVRMRQFDQAGLLSEALARGAVTGDHLDAFAERLARFHGAAAVAPPEGPWGTPEAVIIPALANLEVLARLAARWEVRELATWTHREAERLHPLFADRLARGRVREGHGDLHLGNLVLHQGVVVGFDCLEFNPALRWIDVLSDVAFLAMDLAERREPLLAARLLNRWLSISGDYGGLATWRWYLTYRALVRAKVLALRLEQLQADTDADVDAGVDPEGLHARLESYLALAHRLHRATEPGHLLLTHGVSGSGKSHLAAALCQRHGWVHLRSDVERRRLFGRWGTPLEPVRQGEAYDPAITDELYGTLLPRAAEAVLRAGLTLVVDATFLSRQQRALVTGLADRLATPWWILHCPVTLAIARNRLGQRRREGKDPSEADEGVLMKQWETLEPLTAEEMARTLAVRDIKEAETLLRQRVPHLFGAS